MRNPLDPISLHFYSKFPSDFQGGVDTSKAGWIELLDPAISTTHPGTPKEGWRIGRHSSCDIKLQHKGISRLQATIFRQSEPDIRRAKIPLGWYIISGGAWVDGDEEGYKPAANNPIYISNDRGELIELLPNDPAPIEPGTKILIGFQNAPHITTARIFVRSAEDDTLNDNVWDDELWVPSKPREEKPIDSAIEAKLIEQAKVAQAESSPNQWRVALEALKTPKTWKDFVWRTLLLFAVGVVLVLIFGMR